MNLPPITWPTRLDESETILVRRLSVFAESWTREAAEHVCVRRNLRDGQDIEAPDVRVLMAALADKSLIIGSPINVADQVNSAIEESVRYCLRDAVREYAHNELEESGEREALRGQHRDFFLALAEQMLPGLAGPEQMRCCTRLENEQANLRAALAWCAADTAGAEAGLRLAGALGPFWVMRGHIHEGRQACAGALAHPVALAYPGAQEHRPKYLAARLRALLAAVELAEIQFDYEAVATLLNESLPLAQELGDEPGLIRTLLGLALANGGEETGKEARRAGLEQALRLSRQQSDRNLEAAALDTCGWFVLLEDQNEAARTAWEEALAIYQEAGNSRARAGTLTSLGLLRLKQDEHAAAAELFRTSLPIQQQTGGPFDIYLTLRYLRYLAMAERRGVRAACLLGAGEALHAAMGAFSRYAAGMAPLDAFDWWNRNMADVRDALGAAGFASARAAGRAMTRAQAVEYALGDDG